jgi:TRAP-type C4-dicarboxylate transport system permease small subunit
MLISLELVMRHVNRMATICAATTLGLATAAVLTQIFVRFALPQMGIVVSAPWTEESARFLMVWSVFIGTVVLCRRGGLIAVTALPSALPFAMARWVILASTLCSAVFFTILLVIGWQWSINAWGETATVLRIPMGIVYAAMPVGAALSLINLALHLRDAFSTPEATSTTQLAAQ